MKYLNRGLILVSMIFMQPLHADTEKCNKPLQIVAKSMVGTWVSVALPFDVKVTYKIDGTFSGTIVDHGKVAWTYAGKWQLKGHMFYEEYTYSSLKGIPVGTKDHDQIISVGCDIMTYRAERGVIESMKRIGS